MPPIRSGKPKPNRIDHGRSPGLAPRVANWGRSWVRWPWDRRRDREWRLRGDATRGHHDADRTRVDYRAFRIALTACFLIFGLLSAWLLINAMGLREEARVLDVRDSQLKDIKADLLAYVMAANHDQPELRHAFHLKLRAWCEAESEWLGEETSQAFQSPPRLDSHYSGFLTAAHRRISVERRRVAEAMAARWWNLYVIVLIALGLAVVALVLVNRNLRARVRIADLYFQATRDPMTGGLNRAAVLEDGNRNLERCQREGRPMAVMLVDLDHFKAVNDTFGHAAGDRVIQLSAERLTNNIRAYDSAGRYGGDEFLLVLPFADLEETKMIAERLSRAFAEPIRQPGMPQFATASIGASVALRPGITLEELIATADRALYRRKAKGRNGWDVEVATPRKPAGSEPLMLDKVKIDAVEPKAVAAKSAIAAGPE